MDNSPRMKVCVVGAGVIGLSATLHLLERFPKQLDVTLLADKFPPNTVSDRAVGIFLYTDLGISSDQVLPQTRKWLLGTLERIAGIFKQPENAKVGVSISHGYLLTNSPQPDPWWKDLMFGFRRVERNSAEARVLSIPPDCAEIFAFSTYVLEPTKYMNWMLQRIHESSCKVVRHKISSFDELTPQYDVVINCTGLSASTLLPDSNLYPIRGQGAIVKAPWLKHWVAYITPASIAYVIPRASNVVLGSTAEVGNWSETEDKEIIEDVVQRCRALVPSVVGADTIRNYVGLRPGRDAVRLESCADSNGCLLIHCYGHGGKGVVLSWGCAIDIGDIVQDKLTSGVHKTNKIVSNL